MMFSLILAEVSDKIPAKTSFLIVGAVLLGITALVIVKRWYWALIIEVILIVVLIYGLSQELIADKYMRSAIIKEQGLSYYMIACGALFLPLVAGIAAIVKRKNTKSK